MEPAGEGGLLGWSPTIQAPRKKAPQFGVGDHPAPSLPRGSQPHSAHPSPASLAISWASAKGQSSGNGRVWAADLPVSVSALPTPTPSRRWAASDMTTVSAPRLGSGWSGLGSAPPLQAVSEGGPLQDGTEQLPCTTQAWVTHVIKSVSEGSVGSYWEATYYPKGVKLCHGWLEGAPQEVERVWDIPAHLYVHN